MTFRIDHGARYIQGEATGTRCHRSLTETFVVRVNLFLLSDKSFDSCHYRKKKSGNSWSACYCKIDVTYTGLIRVFHPVYVSGWSRRDETGLDSARTMRTRRVSMIEQLVGSNKSFEASAIVSYAFASFQNSDESRVKYLTAGNRSSICKNMEKFWNRIVIFWKG